MKQIAVLVLALLLSSCARPQVQHEVPPTTDAGPSGAAPSGSAAPVGSSPSSPAQSEGTEPGAEPQHVDLRFLIELDWPAEETAYRPSVEVFPLTNSGMIYRSGVIGPVTFVGHDLQAVNLPFSPTGFGYVEQRGVVKGYTLFGAPDYPWDVLMLTDGSIPLDENGRYISPVDVGHNSAWYDTIGSVIVTFRPLLQGNEWVDSLYGVYDMNEQRYVLPNEYELIHVVDGLLFYAAKDGQSWLFDEKGRELYAFDPAGDVAGWDINWSAFRQYQIDANQQIFYRLSDFDLYTDDAYARIERWGAYYVLNMSSASTNSLTIFDRTGRGLYHSAYDNYYDYFDGYLLVQANGVLIALDSDLREKHFPVLSIGDYFHTLMYDGKELFFRHGGHSDSKSPEQQFSAIDENGNIRSVMYADVDMPPILYRFPGVYIFVGPDHRTIVETDGYIAICGDFVILKERADPTSMRTDPKTVYSLDGRLFIDDIFGCIDQAPGPGGGMFVYLDAYTCVLLMPDGTTAPVSAAPVVEQVYWGG